MPTLTTFANSPDQGRGLARDMPVRWALEEVGRAYEVRAVPWPALKDADHRARQPYGQIPVYEEGDLTLFESGAIVLHIAQLGGPQSAPQLLPADPAARARVQMWMFDAVATIEPVIVAREMAHFGEGDLPGHDERLARHGARIAGRLDALADRLGDADWLEGAFTAADILMIQVLRRLDAAELPPRLAAYVERGKARPAFQRAFAAQLETYRATARA